MFDNVDYAAQEARAEIAANANSIVIEPPKIEPPTAYEAAPVAKSEAVEEKQGEIDF